MSKTFNYTKQNMDLTMNPGTNFHQFATGHWSDNNPRNPEYTSWNNFHVLDDKLDNQLKSMVHELMEQEYTPGSSCQIVRDIYALYCDTERLNREGYQPLIPLFDKIDSFSTNQELVDYIAFRHSRLLFSVFFGTNPNDSNMHMLHLSQAVFNPDEFLSDNPRIVEVREIKRQFTSNLLKLMDKTDAEAKEMVNIYWNNMTELAKECMSLVDQRNPNNTCNVMTIDELQALTPKFDWKHFFKTFDLEEAKEVNVRCMSAIVKACKMYMELPLSELKTMLKVMVISNTGPLLSDAFCDEFHELHKMLAGDCEQLPREKRAINFVTSVLNDVFAQVYVEKYFPEENKQHVLSLVERLRVSFAERIDAQEWMSAETKLTAHEKLNNMKVKIGYPDKWKDMSGLVVDPELSLFDNCENIGEFFWQDAKSKYFNKPVDKTEWYMSPISVNACYSPTNNDITFPAAILQPPFFNMEADDASNLGTIGVIIAHEMTHGFDDSGRKYDTDGNLRNWWTESDIDNFNAICDKMSAFNDTLEALPGLNCNGKLTLGEDIADHGGITIALGALKHILKEHPLDDIDGFTPIQRFFISYANSWAGYIPEESMRQRTINDPHSLPQVRTNAGVQHIDEWYEAFDIQSDAQLYVKKEDRVRVW